MSIDYDLFVIRPSNTGTTESQLRDCIADAIENLNQRIKKLESDNKEETKPTEPLIKDPKIRKAVRAWAEANGIDDIVSYILEDGIEFAGNATKINIRFVQPLIIDTDRRYTIAELCGEEEK